MKTKIKNAVITVSKFVFSLALAVLIFDVNSASEFFAYQPKLPQGSERFKKA